MSNDDYKFEPPDAGFPVDNPWAGTKTPSARCDSCGGPAEGGGLCAVCKRTFEGVLNQEDEPFAPPKITSEAPATEVKSAADIEALFDQFASARAKPPVVEEPVEDAVIAEPILIEPKQILFEPKPILFEMEEEPAAVLAPPPIVEQPVRKPAPVEAVPETETATPAPTRAAAAPRRGLRGLGAVAAAAIVIATIGIPLSKLWLSRQEIVVVQQPEPQPPVRKAATAGRTAATTAPVPERPAAKNEPVVAAAAPKVETRVAARPMPTPAAAPARASAPAPAPAPATAAPELSVPPRPAPKPTRPADQPAVEAPVLAVNAPSASSLPAAEPVTVVAPSTPSTPRPSAAARGPLFETNDVDRAPRVTARVEPALPEGVDQARQEILIVRVLVSQAGNPTLVSLLRPSRSGLALDEAVVDAVKQWTFAPAVRRGEAVSCFLNVAVPVGAR